jgi:phosphonate utilization associated putative membrane protein
MTLSPFTALALSVAMHVAWNLQTRRAEPDSRFLWWALAGYLVVIGPWTLVALVQHADWSGSLGYYLAITCAAEALYFLALGKAYRHAPVPLVYPIARSSPFLIALWTTALFGAALSVQGWLGIVVVVAGMLWLGLSARGGELTRALPWALVAALGTSIYSTSNKQAVTALPGYLTQLGYVTVTLLVAWLALTVENRVRTGRLMPARAPHPLKAIAGGVFIGNAYALVIYAMQFIPAAYAVAYTNAGIVVAGVIAMVFFRERERWRTRLAAMLTICTGLVLIATG